MIANQEKETKKQLAVLQRWCTKWGCYVDSTRSEIVDGDRVTIREHIRRPGDEQLPKDAVSPSCMTLASYVIVSYITSRRVLITMIS